MNSNEPIGVPAKIADWDATFAKDPERWFFGREPSDLARLAYAYWKELRGGEKARVLDLGCGEGRDAVFFTTKGFEVTAVDASDLAIDKMLRLASESNVAIANVVKADVRTYELKPGFDIYYSNNCLQFLGDDCLPRLFDLQRLTRTGGLNAITVFTREAEHLAGRTDLYRFDRNELKFHYREWRLLLYRESFLWREPAQAYLSFASIIATKV